MTEVLLLADASRTVVRQVASWFPAWTIRVAHGQEELLRALAEMPPAQAAVIEQALLPGKSAARREIETRLASTRLVLTRERGEAPARLTQAESLACFEKPLEKSQLAPLILGETKPQQTSDVQHAGEADSSLHALSSYRIFRHVLESEQSSTNEKWLSKLKSATASSDEPMQNAIPKVHTDTLNLGDDVRRHIDKTVREKLGLEVERRIEEALGSQLNSMLAEQLDRAIAKRLREITALAQDEIERALSEAAEQDSL